MGKIFFRGVGTKDVVEDVSVAIDGVTDVTDKLSASQTVKPHTTTNHPSAVSIPLRKRPIAIDLFAGVGGFSLGIEQAGFDVAVAVERDPIHAAVYSRNSPHTEVLCKDVTKLSGQEIREVVAKKRSFLLNTSAEAESPEIDLVIGGPPCQGFSMMGKRRFDDDRNGLVFHFCRLVTELAPRYFVMENVPGMCQGKHSVYLELLCRQFKSAGYQITEPVQVLNAADFGLPQNRRRLFLLGARAGETPLEYPQQTCMQKTTVRDAIADLPNLDEFPELSNNDAVMLSLAQLRQMEASASFYAKKLLAAIAEPDNFAYPRQWNRLMLTSSMQTQHTARSIERFANTLPGETEPISRLRRLKWEGLSHTLRAGTDSKSGSHTSPRPIHPKYPRVISVREAARLHSFPDWFRFHPTKWHGFRQVGNAVPPLLGRAVGNQVISALDFVPLAPPKVV